MDTHNMASTFQKQLLHLCYSLFRIVVLIMSHSNRFAYLCFFEAIKSNFELVDAMHSKTTSYIE